MSGATSPVTTGTGGHPRAPAPEPTRLWEAVAAEVVLGRVPLSELRGTLLVAELGETVFASAVLESAAQARRVMLVDGDADRLDAARDRLEAAVPTFFAVESVRSLSFARDVFEAAFCARGIVTSADANNVLASLVERVRPGGWVGLVAFGEQTIETFDEMLAEAVFATGRERLVAAFEDHRQRRVREHDLEAAALRCGLGEFETGTIAIPVEAPAEALMMSDLVASDLAPAWRAVDEGIREPGTTYGEAMMRLRTYFDGAAVKDALQLLWLVGRVVEPEVLDVDDADVLPLDP